MNDLISSCSLSGKIERLIEELRQSLTIVTVIRAAQQAARISQRTAAYFHPGRLVEVGETEQIPTHPRPPLTEAFLTRQTG
jgi:phosphate transport system ATP-binding protein